MAGPERIHEWLAESTLAFAAATEFPFGRTTLHDLTLDEDEDFMPSSLGSDDDDDDIIDYPTSAATLRPPGPAGDGGLGGPRHRDPPGGPLPADGAGEPGGGKAGRGRRGPVLATDRPFLYSGRLMMVALPGLALIVSVAGDLLITVLNIGAMLVYLLHVAGVKKKALVAYILTFGCCQIIVIYSALPLLWHTALNIFLIGLLNSFTILTGAWGLLLFDYFRTSEPDLTRVDLALIRYLDGSLPRSELIETCLFGLYPAINVILVTWIIGSGISPVVAPYGLIAIGFMVLQLFMTPTPSSFNKPSPKDAELVYVLDSAAVGAMALAYAALPPGVYTYLTVVRAHQPLLSAYFLVELAFLSCLSTFLATLMNLREFLEIAGLEYKYLQRVRWAFGLTALLLLSAVLHKYGFSFYLLPWLTLGLALHTGHGFFSRHRQFKTKSAAAALVLLCLYSFIFGKLPWKLELYLKGSGFHINTVQALLFVNALLCVACVYASTNSGTALLGWLVTLQTVGLVVAEKLLWAGHHYLTSLLVLSAITAIYFILRLFHAKKLSWQAACLCIAVHLTKLTNCCDSVIHRGAASPGSALYEDITSLLLGLLFTRALLFEKDTITFKKWLSYMVAGIVVLSLAMPALLYKSFIIVFGTDPTFSDLMAVGLLLAAGLSVKLSLQGDNVHSWLGLSHVGPTAVVMSVVLFHLKPEPILNWEEGNKWLVIINLVSCFLLVPMAALSKSSLVLTLIGLALGLPLGVSAAVWMLPGEVATVGLLLSGLLGATLTCVGLFVWRQVAALEAKLRTLLILVAAINVALFILDDDDVTENGMPSHTLLAATVSSTIVALILKLHSQRQNDVDLTAINPPVNRLALIGNTCAVLSYLLLCVSCPTKLWELWFIITSSALLLLQRDHLLLTQLSRRNSAAPLAAVTSLVLWVSTQWNSFAWAGLSIPLTLTGIVELLIVYSTIPLYIIYFTVLWQNQFYISDRLVVFVTPVNAFLFVFGSSFQAWALAVYGIGVGVWLIKYKLPLNTNDT